MKCSAKLIKINASELKLGMFFYAIITEVQEIDIKRMIITD
jgi:hypothetical protein